MKSYKLNSVSDWIQDTFGEFPWSKHFALNSSTDQQEWKEHSLTICKHHVLNGQLSLKFMFIFIGIVTVLWTMAMTPLRCQIYLLIPRIATSQLPPPAKAFSSVPAQHTTYDLYLSSRSLAWAKEAAWRYQYVSVNNNKLTLDILFQSRQGIHQLQQPRNSNILCLDWVKLGENPSPIHTSKLKQHKRLRPRHVSLISSYLNIIFKGLALHDVYLSIHRWAAMLEYHRPSPRQLNKQPSRGPWEALPY